MSKVDCRFCNGTGKAGPVSICQECNGSGKVDADIAQAQNKGLAGLAVVIILGLIIFSDKRLKTNIKEIGKVTHLNLPLYSWKYLWGKKRFVGVMAQDVLQYSSLVNSVYSINIAGKNILAVNYKKLGLQLITEKEWIKHQKSIYI